MKKIFLFFFFFSGITFSLKSQNVVVNSSGASGDASAGLDVDFTDKGLLVPRVTQTQRNAISSPATSLLIFQTDNTPGYYFNSGTPASPTWSLLAVGGSSGSGWNILGNSGTADGTNFIGTTDNIPLNFRINNLKAGRVDLTSKNTFLGFKAGNASTNAADQNNTAIGDSTLITITTGVRNTAVGSNAGKLLSAGGNDITAIGFDALKNNNADQNTAVGSGALTSNNTGVQNTAVGYQALYNNGTNLNGNTAVGYWALFTNGSGGAYNASYNTAVGDHCLYRNTGQYNVGLGVNSGYGVGNGNYNTIVGFEAVLNNYSGQAISNNSIFGAQAGWSSAGTFTGGNNCFFGYKSGSSNSSGSNNILFGYQAGDNITTGSANIILGNDIDAPSATNSNQLSIGNLIYGSGLGATGTTVANGKIGINNNSPSGTFDITQPVATTGSPNGIIFSGGAHTTLTASTEANDVNINLARTVQFSSGALVTQRAFLIQAPTYGFSGASTITNASTVAITGAPVKGTNATLTNTHGLLIQAGAVSTATNSYGLSVNAQTGATNNYSAQFIGGNVGIGTASPRQALDLNGGLIWVEAVSAPSLLNSWVNFGSGFSNAGYWKDSEGNVHLQGLIKSGTIGQIAFTLPAGYFPADGLKHYFSTASNGSVAGVEVDASGNVTPQYGSNNYLSLEGIVFRSGQ